MGDAVGTLDQQDVKTGCALGNGLHHIIQQRDEGYEAQTETWHPTVWTLLVFLSVAVLCTLLVLSFLAFTDHFLLFSLK